MEHFGAVCKLYLTEKTRTQLQEEEAILPNTGYAYDRINQSINQPNLVFVRRRLNKVLRGASYE